MTGNSLRFAGDWHPLLVLALALGVALLVAWFYLRETRTLSSPANYLIPGLRATAVALAILVLSGPVLHRRRTIGSPGRVVFAVDQSLSMSETDSVAGDSDRSRLRRASRLLTGTDAGAGWLERLSTTHETEVLAFADQQPVKIWSSAEQSDTPISLDLDAQGGGTDLSAPLRAISATAVPQQQVAVVLLTEGRHNTGDAPADMAGQLAARGVTVHAIGIGSPEPPRDVRLVDIDYPETVAADARLSGTITMAQSGFQGQAIDLRVEHDRRTVWKETVRAEDDKFVVPFSFELDSLVDEIDSDSPAGVEHGIAVLNLEVVVDPIEGETRSENNAASFRIAATTRQQRLLIVDGSSRWEIRYLKNLFTRDPEWSVDTLLFGVGTDHPQIQRGSDPGQFPNTPELIRRYDAIVLGEVPDDQWSEADANLLRGFVSQGGGVIFIDGRFGRLRALAADSLADLIPVRYLDSPRQPIESLQLTRAGIDHPALRLWPGGSDQARFWSQVPRPATAPLVEAGPAVQVLAEWKLSDSSSTPWLVTRLYGGGRVFYLSTGQTWRWRYKVADRFHAKFWHQLVAAVVPPPYSARNDYVALGTDKIEYRAGQSATIRAQLRNADGEPLGDSTVEAILIRNNQVVSRVPLNPDDPARGTYRGVSRALAAGAYSIRIRAGGIPAGALQTSTPIWVLAPDHGELGDVTLDEAMLRSICSGGSGVYLHESQADEILAKLKPLSSGQIVESDILIWQSFYWFAMIMSLLTAEWLLRKRAGLV